MSAGKSAAAGNASRLMSKPWWAKMLPAVAVIPIACCCCCGGLGMPPPTSGVVSTGDVVGTWEYTAYDRDFRTEFPVRITFFRDHRYAQDFSASDNPELRKNEGMWSLKQAEVRLENFYDVSKREHIPDVHWWMTSWYSWNLRLFGGDSLDPDDWYLLKRIDDQPPK